MRRKTTGRNTSPIQFKDKISIDDRRAFSTSDNPNAPENTGWQHENGGGFFISYCSPKYTTGEYFSIQQSMYFDSEVVKNNMIFIFEADIVWN